MLSKLSTKALIKLLLGLMISSVVAGTIVSVISLRESRRIKASLQQEVYDLQGKALQIDMEKMSKKMEQQNKELETFQLKVSDLSLSITQSTNMASDMNDKIQSLKYVPIDNITVCDGLYDINDVGKISNLSVEQWKIYTKGTGLQGHEQAIYDVEHFYSVNGFFILGTNVNEVGWKSDSKIAQDKNNLFNIGAYNSSPYESAYVYGTKDESILHFGGFIRYNYINENGKSFNGYGIHNINVRYAQLDNGSPNPSWGRTIISVMNKLGER